MKTPFGFVTRFILAPIITLLLVIVPAFSRIAFAIGSPSISSAVIQNSTLSTVDIVISGSNYNQFYDNHSTMADPVDLSHIHYNGNTPTIAIMSGSTITATFPIAVGTYKSGGTLTISANTLDRNGLTHNTATLTLADGNITDNAKPVVVFSDIDGDALDASTNSPQPVKITFSEPISVSFPPTVIISPDGAVGGEETVNDCGDTNAATWCFNYTIPTNTTGTETMTIATAQDTASSPNTMDSDNGHTFTVSPYEPILDISGDMVNSGTTQVEIIVPSIGPALTSFWYSGTINADGTDLSQISYGPYHPTSATIDTEGNALDLFFNISDGFQTIPQGDIDIGPGTVVADGSIGNSEDFVPQGLITDNAAPVIVSAQAAGSGVTSYAQLTLSENIQDIDGGDVAHPNFTVKNATTGQVITINGADIAESLSDNHVDIVLDTSDPDNYDGPLSFSYDAGAPGTQIIDFSGNHTASVTDFPIAEANPGYHVPTIDSGSGTPSDPYRISTCAGIADINNHLSSSFLLTADADCTNQGNSVMVGTDGGPFTGMFDGGGHIVTISLNQSEYSIGLFRRADGATITNVILAGSAQGFSSVGALVGWASNTTISYVGSSANVSTGGAGNVGGLVGIDTAGSTISNSYNTGNVTGGDNAGGILGQGNGTTIKNVYATGSVSGGNDIGGIVGRIVNGGLIIDSFAATAISGSTGLGSLIGESNTVNIRNDYFDADRSTIGTVCLGDTSNPPQCQAENQGGADPMYFKNNNDSSPLNDWDFINVWTTTSTYPVFQAPIHVAPSKPFNVTHTSEDSSSVSLSWDAPMYNIDSITDYVIEYQPHNSNTWATFNDGISTNTTTTVTGLSSGTDYDFRISAVNSIGTGLVSDTTEDTTSSGGGGSPFAGGDGSTGNPYLISSCSQLATIGTNYVSSSFSLQNDLDCTSTGNGVMIGDTSSAYLGTFNGNGHTIKVSINDPSDDVVALFRETDGATIEQLRVSGRVVGRSVVAGLVASAIGTTITQAINSANIISNQGGGLIAQLSAGSIVSDSYSEGDVLATGTGGGQSGAFVMMIDSGSTIQRSYASGALTSGAYEVASFAGSDQATITDSFAVGVLHNTSVLAGGFSGEIGGGIDSSLSNDFWDIDTTGQAHCGQHDDTSIATPGGCTGITGQSTYFKNNSANAPFNNGKQVWDFTGVWDTSSGYPVLRHVASDGPSSNTLTVSVTTPTDSSVALSNNWHPVVDWGAATTCQYAYGSDSYQTVTCSNNGSDIPAPTGSDFSTVTLNIKGSASGASDGTASSTFFYYQTAQTAPTGGPDFAWNHQSGWPGGIALHMARSADGSKVIASADIGDVHTSTDGGVSWNDQPSLGSHTWNSVAMSATGQFMLASIYGGDTYLSSDAGSNWTDVGTLSGGPGSMSGGASVAMSADGKYMYIAGSGYDLYRSENSGASWQLLTTGDNGWGGLAASADGKYLAALNGGNLYTSSDYGNTFSSASGVPGGNLNALGLSADGSTIAVGGWHGDVGVSRNFGSTWNDETALGDHFWYGFGLSADGTVIAAGVNYDSSTTTGPMYISTDGGNSFTAQTNITNDNWQSFGVSADGTQVLAFGNDSGLSSLGSSGGGGGGGGGGTVGDAKITVTDISGNPISNATVDVACPAWSGFSFLGSTNGSGVLESNPCGGASWPISIQVTASGYYQNEQDFLWYGNTIDPENEIGGSTNNQYHISLIPVFDGTGSGKSNDPYIITTCSQLEGIQGDLSAYYRFNSPNDIIDCTGIDFQPIGQNGAPFTGNLEGLGLVSNDTTTIENVTINRPDLGGVGIFGYASGATIKDLALNSGSVNGSYNVGSLVGLIDGGATLQYISSNFTINAVSDGDEGGIVGEATLYNGIANDFSHLTYNGSMDINEGDIGGIIGYLTVTGTDTSATIDHAVVSGGAVGSYTSGASYNVGGLIGYMNVNMSSDGASAGVTISNANVSSTVSGDGGGDVGGLVGNAYLGSQSGTSSVSITQSSVTGSVSGGYSVGGLIGDAEVDDNGGPATFDIDQSSSSNDITGTQNDIGGLIGHVYVFNNDPRLVRFKITNSSNTGNITGDSSVGGLIGGTEGEGPGIFLSNASSTGGLILQNDYATGNVTGNVNADDAQYTGGLVGWLWCYSSSSQNPFGCSIASSYATGNVSGYRLVGGLIGYDGGDVSVVDAYAHGNVLGNNEVGGLIGQIDPTDTNILVTHTYATGAMSSSGTGSDIGGLIGKITGGAATVSDSFAQTNMDGVTAGGSVGFMIANPAGGTPSNLWYVPTGSANYGCTGLGGNHDYCHSDGDTAFFQNSTTNGPLTNWDFTSAPIWVSHNKDYPTLTGVVENITLPAPTVSITTPSDSSTVTTWAPVVDWGNATTCDYSYGDSNATNQVICSANGADIPVPNTTGSQTLNIRGSNVGGASSLISSSFTYNPDISSEIANTSAYWKMDETAQGSTVVDSSTNGNNGTVAGSPRPSSDNPGLLNITPDTESLNFNPETSGLVDVPDSSSLNLNGSFSVAFWMKPTSWNDGQSRGVISKFNPDSDRGFVVYDDGSDSCDGSCGALLNFRAHGSAGTQDYLHSTASVDVGSWQHWAIVYNNATHTVKIYKNGTLDTTYTGITIGDATNVTDLVLGFSQPWSSYFNGNLDDFRLYQNALTPSDVAYLAATGTPDIQPFTPTPPSGGGSRSGGTTGGSSFGGSSSASNTPVVVTTSTSSTGTSNGTAYHFTRNLKQGIKSGDDIVVLQKFLNNNGFPISKSGPGSKGHETKSFGAGTKKALMKFQKANKISPANGVLGPKTKAAIEKLMNK